MTQKVKAKFVGDDTDNFTRALAIRNGVKYDLEIVEAGFWDKFFSGFELFAVLKRGATTDKKPYQSRNAFLRNWKVYRNGGVRV